MFARFSGLWRHPEFMKLWAGQTISQFGSIVTRDALPLVAVLTLQATPAEMGLLAAAGSAPILIFGLLAGAWVDRLRRRPILIAADLGRALLLLFIPLAAFQGWLQMSHLYIIAALTGILAVFFDVAYRSFLPSLVTQDQLVEGNSKLGMSDSIAEIGGSAIAGFLVQFFTAPLTVLIDAVSFIVSALSLLSIRSPEIAPPPVAEGQSLRQDVLEGLRVVFEDPILRALAAQAATSRFFGSFFGAVYGLYALQTLGMTPGMLGIVVACGGIGALLGAMVAEPAARRWGLGTLLIGALLVSGAATLLIPLAFVAGPLALLCMMAAQIVGDMADTVYAINGMSLRQTITPDRLLGRTIASNEVIVGGASTLGLLVGGLLGNVVGLYPTVWIAALGGWAAILWLMFSPIRHLEQHPTPLALGVGD